MKTLSRYKGEKQFLPKNSKAGILSIALAALATGSSVWAATVGTTVNWTGAVNSDYTNAGNWSTGVVPNDPTYAVALPSSATNRVINLNYTGVGDTTYNLGGISTGITGAYALNLSGTSAGRLTYNFTAKGTFPYGTDPNTNSTGTTSNRLWFYLNVGPYTTLSLNGTTTNAAVSNGGLGLAYLNVASTGIVDMITQGGTAAQVGAVDIAAGGQMLVGIKNLGFGGLANAGTTQTIAGSIVGTGATTATHDKWGTGDMVVTSTGSVTLPGTFRLRGAGGYYVDGVHNSTILAHTFAGGILGGTGTINADVNVGTATVASILTPARAGTAGRLTINGNISLLGALRIDLISPTQTDLLVNNGTLTIGSSGKFVLAVADSFPLVPATYRVVTATSVVGSFASTTFPSASWSYQIGSNFIDVTYIQRPFVDQFPELTGNHNRFASMLDKATNNGMAPSSVVDTLNRKDVIFFRNVADQLTPTVFYSWFPAAVERARSMIKVVDDRPNLRGVRNVGSFDSFAQVYRQEASIDRNAELNSDYSNFDTSSVVAGFDYAMAPGLVAGALLNYSDTHSDLDMEKSISTTKSYTGALYAKLQRGAVSLQALGFAGIDEYASRRNVSYTQLGSWARGDTKGVHMGASLTGEYVLKYSWIEVIPTAGVQLLDWRVKKFSETDAGQAALLVGNQYEMAVTGLAGLKFAQTYKISRGAIRPFVALNFQREFMHNDRWLKATLWGERMSYIAPGLQANGTSLDLGIDFDVSQKISAQIRYSAGSGGATDERLAVRAGLTAHF